MSRDHRKYTPDDRAVVLAALEANGGNVARTARQTRTPRKTVAEWAAGRAAPGEPLRQEKRLALADQLEQLAHMLLGDLANDELRKRAGLRDLAIALGILVDKMQLLRGKPTSIEAGHLTLEQANRADDELERWRGGRVPKVLQEGPG